MRPALADSSEAELRAVEQEVPVEAVPLRVPSFSLKSARRWASTEKSGLPKMRTFRQSGFSHQCLPLGRITHSLSNSFLVPNVTALVGRKTDGVLNHAQLGLRRLISGPVGRLRPPIQQKRKRRGQDRDPHFLRSW